MKLDICPKCKKKKTLAPVAETEHTVITDKNGNTRDYTMVHVECSNCHLTTAYEK